MIVMHRRRELLAVPTDPYRTLALVDLDLVDAGVLEQLDQLPDLADVHAGTLSSGRPIRDSAARYARR